MTRRERRLAQSAAAGTWSPPEGVTAEMVVSRSGRVFVVLECGHWIRAEPIETTCPACARSQLDDASMSLLIAQEEPLPPSTVLELAAEEFEANVAGMGRPQA